MLTNNKNVPVNIAAYLAYDDYDYDPRPNSISVTTLIKPIKQTVLSKRVENYSIDILDLVKSRIGQSIHGAIENVWFNDSIRNKALKTLGYPDDVINRIVINPEKEPEGDQIPIYLEQRIEREFMGFIVRGKFDFCGEGILRDTKSTSTFTYTSQSKVEDYILQASIYRWLAPHIVTEDYFVIDYIFTDWKKGIAKIQPDYPQTPYKSQEFPLMSLKDTEEYIREKLTEIKKSIELEESKIPVCTDIDLWKDPDTYQYFTKAENTRAAKNFDNPLDAQAHLTKQGKGVIKIKQGKAKACEYCKAAEICEQRKQLLEQGLLDE